MMMVIMTIVVIIMMIKICNLLYHKYEQHSILIYEYNDYHIINITIVIIKITMLNIKLIKVYLKM
jgi:hypothetical protein